MIQITSVGGRKWFNLFFRILSNLQHSTRLLKYPHLQIYCSPWNDWRPYTKTHVSNHMHTYHALAPLESIKDGRKIDHRRSERQNRRKKVYRSIVSNTVLSQPRYAWPCLCWSFIFSRELSPQGDIGSQSDCALKNTHHVKCKGWSYGYQPFLPYVNIF